jgi:sugar (pentulose or hexulose) kinase
MRRADLPPGIVAGVDIATQGVRAVCSDAGGRVLGAGEQALPAPHRPAPGWVEQDATTWWPAVAGALRAATGALDPAARARIVAVTVSGTSGTVVLADRRGEPMGPALLYSDGRAAADAELAQRAGATRWRRLGLRIAPSFGLPKLAWLCRQPGVRDAAAHAWSATDLVVGRLLGASPPTDWSHALKSGYDALRLEWPADVYDALDVPLRLLPDVLPPTASAGLVGADASAATGLPRGCEVRLGMTDGCAAQVACGSAAPGDFVSVLGTTLVVKGVSEKLLVDPAGAVYSHRHVDGWWLPGGASNVGGGALAHGSGVRDLRALDRAAAERGPATVITYPLIGVGERFPVVDPNARSFLVGSPADDIERHRATLEGVAFVERLAYDRLAALGADIGASIASAGGGGRSAVWNRIRATVLDRTLLLPRNPTTAAGACVLAASGTLHPTLGDAAKAMVDIIGTVEPYAAERDALDASYEHFVAELRQRGWLGGPA